jgi:membrane protein
MNDLLTTILVGGATGVLLGTAGAKAWAAARARLMWPKGANFLRFHLSAGLVIAAEVLASVAALSLPSLGLSCFVLALVYATFVVGATTLRGQECGCFGVEGMRVGPVHIWGCAATSAILGFLAATNYGATASRPARLAVALITGLVIVLAFQLWKAWSKRREERAAEQHDRLFVVLSSSCTACSALKTLENREISDTEAAGTIHWVDENSESAASIREAGVEISGFPAVVSLSSADPASALVRSGLQECREVLQSWRQSHLVLQP